MLATGGLALADERAGIPAWRRLRGDLGAARARIETLSREVEALRGEVRALETDAFASEAVIRQDLGLALPGEIVVRLDALPPASGARPGGAPAGDRRR